MKSYCKRPRGTEEVPEPKIQDTGDAENIWEGKGGYRVKWSGDTES